MKNYSICFSTLYEKFVAWTWQELLFGVKNNIIAIEDIVNYTNDTISEDNNDVDILMQILIADTDEVESIVEKLALKEEEQCEDDIVSKWIFTIIYFNYTTNKGTVFDEIDDIYCEFDYPEEISGLVSYMPKEDEDDLDDKLEKYINRGKEIWFLKS